MRLTISNDLKHILYGSAITLLLCGSGYFGYNYYQNSQLNNISADSSLYQEVRRNDLHYLHKVGNKDAKQANYEYALTVAGRRGYVPDNTTGVRSEPSLPQHFLNKRIKYHHDKYGNYWSWFEDHQSIMPDDLNGRFAPRDFSGTTSSKVSGILANEKVLRNHSVHSGVNFIYNGVNQDD